MQSNLKFSLIRVPVVLFSVGILAACASRQYSHRVDEVVAWPPHDPGARVVDSVGTWFSDFGIERLDSLISTAFSRNLEFAAAWRRVAQAEAIARHARGGFWPSLDGGLSFSRSEAPALFPGDPQTVERFRSSFSTNYEIDLWGRTRHRYRAGRLDAEAAEADARALAISLAAQVCERFMDVAAGRLRIALLLEQIETSRDYLELIKLRLAQGQATGLDVNQQLQQIEALRGRLALARSEDAVALHQLAVLVGTVPGMLVLPGDYTLPEIDSLPFEGVAASLLLRRPDVRAARLRLEAADSRTAAAVAERLPSLALSAEVFFQAENLTSLLERVFWNVTGGLTQPLFAGGRLAAEVDRSEAAAAEQLLLYSRNLLIALEEVRTAMVQEAAQAEYLESLLLQFESASSSAALARQRYLQGASDFLRVLTALQSKQRIELEVVDARRRRISLRIQLYRALGGGWVDEVSPSTLAEPS